MPCKSCDPTWPGKLIKTTKSGNCIECGLPAISIYKSDNSKWDRYFFLLCEAIATKSPCLSRQIGALLVKDRSIVSTGYNGPPRGVPHCGRERFMKDDHLTNSAKDIFYDAKLKKPHPECLTRFRDECPRKVFGFRSGEGMRWCPAQHAEENAISNAARLGTSVYGATLYMNSLIPCQKCFGTLINAGITCIVVSESRVYDKHTQYLIDSSSIKIRRFDL